MPFRWTHLLFSINRQADAAMIATLRYCSAPSRYTLTLRFIDGDDDGVIRSRSR